MALLKLVVLIALCVVAYSEDEFVLRPNIPGGISEADRNSETYKEALDFALVELNKLPVLGTTKLVLKEVLLARSQVVAGTMHYFTLHIVPSVCEKTAAATETCEPLSEEAGFTCSLKVVSRPWENVIEVLKDQISCVPM